MANPPESSSICGGAGQLNRQSVNSVKLFYSTSDINEWNLKYRCSSGQFFFLRLSIYNTEVWKRSNKSFLHAFVPQFCVERWTIRRSLWCWGHRGVMLGHYLYLCLEKWVWPILESLTLASFWAVGGSRRTRREPAVTPCTLHTEPNPLAVRTQESYPIYFSIPSKHKH